MFTQELIRVHIRWMVRRDMVDVLRIEEENFEHFAWNEEGFLAKLRQRNCIGMVAEHQDRVVGYMLYELHKGKLVLLNLAVDPSLHRQGVGSQLVQKLQSKLSSHHRTRLHLEVRETNLAAQLFFKAMGFRAVRVLRGHCEDGGEDAYLMEYRVSYMPELEPL